MKKFILVLLMLALVFLPVSAFASVGVKQDGVHIGTATDLDFPASGFTVSSDGSTSTITYGGTLLANGRKGGASTMSSSSTTLGTAGISYSYVAKRVGGGGGLDSDGIGSVLPNGVAGQMITFAITALQSGGSWVVTPTNSTTFSKITFDTVGDTAILLYVSTSVGWVVSSQSGCTVTVNALP